MSEKKNLSIAKKTKKVKPLKKAVYPSKTTLNMAQKEKTDLEPKKLIPALVIVLLLLAVFAKFAVLDRLAEVRALESQLSDLESTRATMQVATKEYDEVHKMYEHYSSEWMTEDLKNIVPSTEILDLLEKHLMPRGQILSLATSGGTISVDVGNIDLEIAASFVEDLYTLPTIADVRVYSAESVNPSGKQLQINFIINMIPQSVAAAAATQGGDAE